MGMFIPSIVLLLWFGPLKLAHLFGTVSPAETSWDLKKKKHIYNIFFEGLSSEI